MNKKSSKIANTGKISSEIDYKEVGRRIRKLRGAESQAGYGSRFGKSYMDIGRIERGEVRPTPDLLFKIGAYHEVTMDWLLTGQAPAMKKEYDRVFDYAFEKGMEAKKKEPPGVAEKGATFHINIKSVVAEHNRDIIERWLGQIKRIIEEGDYRKTSAVQSLLEVLDPEKPGREE